MKNVTYIFILILMVGCVRKFPKGIHTKKMIGGEMKYSFKKNKFQYKDFHNGDIGSGDGIYKIEKDKIILYYNNLTYSYIGSNKHIENKTNTTDTLLIKNNQIIWYK